jgi:hypothetical protein
MLDISITVILATLAITLVAWFLKYKSNTSDRRLNRMMRRLGLDPDNLDQEATQTIISEVRSRCRRCQTEARCERWLEGIEVGENTFCPNARVFEVLKSGA